MSKIICDICGTSYPDTADQCPICGCSKDFKLEEPLEEPTQQIEEKPAKPVAAKPAKPAAPAKPAKPVPAYDDEDEDEEDYDEDDEYEDDEAYDDDDEYDDDEDDDDDDEEEHKSNAPLVILLVVIILALLAVSAFIIIKYFVPSMKPEQTQPTTIQTDAPTQESTELTIPCENLALTSGGEVVLDMEGANWLINVMALPENTTDKLVYASSDETVAIVNEQGKVTAVGEGIAVITITCGSESLTCTVTVDFTPETTVPETEPEETTAPTEASTEPEETTPPAPAKTMGVITATTLNIRASANKTAATVGVYMKGDKVEILEEKTVEGTNWGRTDKGWISMQYVELEADANSITGTTTANILSIRSTPGADGTVVGSYAKGTKVTILETRKVGDTTWGRTNKGWISMDYVDQD